MKEIFSFEYYKKYKIFPTFFVRVWQFKKKEVEKILRDFKRNAVKVPFTGKVKARVVPCSNCGKDFLASYCYLYNDKRYYLCPKCEVKLFAKRKKKGRNISVA